MSMLPLAERDYRRLLAPLGELPINTLFARAVIERRVTGRIFVDNLDVPRTYYVVHPYGMTLLFGDPAGAEFNARFRDHALNTPRTRDRHEWMQAWPAAWEPVLNALFADRLIRQEDNAASRHAGVGELNTRINFRFDRQRYRLRRPSSPGRKRGTSLISLMLLVATSILGHRESLGVPRTKSVISLFCGPDKISDVPLLRSAHTAKGSRLLDCRVPCEATAQPT